MDKSPKVGVIIAAYNAASTIERAIKSIENQTYKNWEIIIVDDASTDDTAKIAEKYEKVRVIKQKSNTGAANARDIGVKKSDAEIIAHMDADDESDKERLEIQLNTLLALEKEKKKPILLYTGRWIAVNEKKRWVMGNPAIGGEVWFTDKKKVLARKYYPLGPTLMMRKKDYLELGGQHVTDVGQLESDFQYRAVNKGFLIAHIGLPLYIQYQSPTSYRHRLHQVKDEHERFLKLWDPKSKHPDNDRKIDEEDFKKMSFAVHRGLARRFLRQKDNRTAREQAKKAEAFGSLPKLLKFGLSFPFAFRVIDSFILKVKEKRLLGISRVFSRKIRNKNLSSFIK